MLAGKRHAQQKLNPDPILAGETTGEDLVVSKVQVSIWSVPR
jgi:hypothetical protein